MFKACIDNFLKLLFMHQAEGTAQRVTGLEEIMDCNHSFRVDR